MVPCALGVPAQKNENDPTFASKPAVSEKTDRRSVAGLPTNTLGRSFSIQSGLHKVSVVPRPCSRKNILASHAGRLD
jgi:hypothetical protein